jgi:hypothetical protein
MILRQLIPNIRGNAKAFVKSVEIADPRNERCLEVPDLMYAKFGSD